MADFAATVAQFGDHGMEFMQDVLQDGTRRLIDFVKLPGPTVARGSAGQGGNMPVDLGNLRRSLLGSTTNMPTIDPTADENVGDGSASIELTIKELELGGTAFFGFTAAYAMRQNYGFTGADSLGRVYNQAGYLFVEKAAERWQEFVNEAAAAVGPRPD